jgi:hypothetical protein
MHLKMAFGQDEFQQGIQMYMSMQSMRKIYLTMMQSGQSLGDNAAARTEAASLFANQFFPERSVASY